MTPRDRPLTKQVFLEALACERRGWLLHNPDQPAGSRSFAQQFRFTQGNAIGDLARQMYAPGLDLRGPSTAEWLAQGRTVVADPATSTAFEVPLVAQHAIARPDILVREPGGWHVIEVKSAKQVKAEDVDDLAYTVAVVCGAGLAVVRASLALVNPDWRVDNDLPALLAHDVTDAALARATEFAPLFEPVHRAVSAPTAPLAVLKSVCKNCEFLRSPCHLDGPSDPVFELPRILGRKADALIAGGIARIAHVPEGEKLTPIQQLHRRAVIAGGLVTEAAGLAQLAQVRAPTGYLDFETLSLALPPFPGMAPYDVIPIQYSLHRRMRQGDAEHRELLLDPRAPDIEEFARHLLQSLDGLESIVVYSSFERQRLLWLSARLPAMTRALDRVADRLVDLLPIVQASVAHPEFHGSLSIKRVLPVLVPDLRYDDLAIGNGDDATGISGLRAMGRIDDAEWALHRRHLLEYCKVDTLAMVRLHDALAGLAG